MNVSSNARVMKAGAAYVAMDASQPEHRLSGIAKYIGANAILTFALRDELANALVVRPIESVGVFRLFPPNQTEKRTSAKRLPRIHSTQCLLQTPPAHQSASSQPTPYSGLAVKHQAAALGLAQSPGFLNLHLIALMYGVVIKDISMTRFGSCAQVCYSIFPEAMRDCARKSNVSECEYSCSQKL